MNPQNGVIVVAQEALHMPLLLVHAVAVVPHGFRPVALALLRQHRRAGSASTGQDRFRLAV